MIALRAILIVIMFTMTGCATQNASVQSNSEFVEIANPAFTMTPDASATILVPRHYVEEGMPRGNELIKKGYENVVSGQPWHIRQEQSQAAQPTPLFKNDK